MGRATYVLIDGELVTKSIDGIITDEYRNLSNDGANKNPFNGFGSDSLPGGVNGIINHADGKRYDSKSQYESAVKASGCRIVGNDWNNASYKTPTERGIRGDFNVRPELKRSIQKAGI